MARFIHDYSFFSDFSLEDAIEYETLAVDATTGELKSYDNRNIVEVEHEDITPKHITHNEQPTT